MELFILNKKVAAMLAERNIKVFRTYVGEYMTSLEMAGASVTLLKTDEELKDLLAAPADTPGFKQLGSPAPRRPCVEERGVAGWDLK